MRPEDRISFALAVAIAAGTFAYCIQMTVWFAVVAVKAAARALRVADER